MSTHYWDEDPQGLWTLGLENKGYYFNTGESWLRLLGCGLRAAGLWDAEGGRAAGMQGCGMQGCVLRAAGLGTLPVVVDSQPQRVPGVFLERPCNSYFSTQ